MALPNPATGDTVAATDVSDIKNHLEGGSAKTAPYHLKQSSGSFQVTLADAAGATYFRLNDSAGSAIFTIDSDGNVIVVGTLTNGTFIFPLSATPTLTTEGSAAFDTDDNTLKIYDGAATKEFGYLGTATPADLGTAAAGTSKETSHADHVHAGEPGLVARAAFRTERRLLGEYTGGLFQSDGTSTFFAPNGIGYSWTTTNGNMSTVDGPEPSVSINGNNAGASHFFGSTDPGSSIQTTLVTKPANNPRMLLRWLPGAAHANMTTIVAGFFQGTITSTIGGAYLRANTTGNLFFVTRQGGAETTTDLGARPSVLTSYEIYTEDAGVTWICRNDTTDAVVATHTGDVPTAATNVGYGAGVIISAQIVAAILNLGYMRVDASY